MTTPRTLYAVLGVDEDASGDDILRAYRRLAAMHHPDAGGDAELFHAATEARTTLSDPAARAAYDGELDILRRAGALPPADGELPVAVDFTVAGADPTWFLRSDREPGDTRSPSWSPRRPEPAAPLVGATASALGVAAAAATGATLPAGVIAAFVLLGALAVTAATWGNRASAPVALVVLAAPAVGVAGLAVSATACAVAAMRTQQVWALSVSKMVEVSRSGVTAR